MNLSKQWIRSSRWHKTREPVPKKENEGHTILINNIVSQELISSILIGNLSQANAIVVAVLIPLFSKSNVILSVNFWSKSNFFLQNIDQSRFRKTAQWLLKPPKLKCFKEKLRKTAQKPSQIKAATIPLCIKPTSLFHFFLNFCPKKIYVGWMK